MLVGERLRQIREERNLTQGDVGQRTGLLPNYISRVENGHTIPALETLEKFARALEVPLYVLVCDGNAPAPSPANFRACRRDTKETAFERRLVKLLARMDERQRELLFDIAQRMARRGESA